MRYYGNVEAENLQAVWVSVHTASAWELDQVELRWRSLIASLVLSRVEREVPWGFGCLLARTSCRGTSRLPRIGISGWGGLRAEGSGCGRRCRCHPRPRRVSPIRPLAHLSRRTPISPPSSRSALALGAFTSTGGIHPHPCQFWANAEGSGDLVVAPPISCRA